MKLELPDFDSNTTIVELLELLIKFSLQNNASDLHIDPEQDKVRIRLRIDGRLFEIPNLKIDRLPEIISRIKIMAGLRIDEHFKPQDGRFRINLESKIVDIRVSILPTYYGENAVLRILSDQSEFLDLNNLGFEDSELKKIKKAISKTGGMVLVTGPTGSGKTTTLYSMIKELNREETSIITIEEPIEYSLSGIRQTQVNPGSNLNFANGLRSILRQDPNIIMVGEIRDSETAGLAINASLTGHLLLSTLHTNDAAATIPRLLDMGIEPFLLASTFSIAINQRLVKKICPNCKIEEKISYAQKNYLEDLTKEVLLSQKFYTGAGCDFCSGRGFSGRLAICEILIANDNIRNFILERRPTSEIKNLAIKNGMKTLLQDGFEKVKSGLAELKDVFGIIYE